MPHPTPPHFKNNNPREGGESAAHQKQLKTSTIQTVTRARVFILGGGGDGSQVKKEIQDLGGGVWQSFAPSKLFAPGARKLQLQKETMDLHLHQLNWG